MYRIQKKKAIKGQNMANDKEIRTPSCVFFIVREGKLVYKERIDAFLKTCCTWV